MRKRSSAGSRAALTASILLHLLIAGGLRWLPRDGARPPASVFDAPIDVTFIQPAAREPEVAAHDGPLLPVPEPRRRRGPGPPRHRVRDDRPSIPDNGFSAPPSESGPADSDSPRPPADPTPPNAMGDAENLRARSRVDLSFEGLAGDAKLRALPSARDEPLLYPSPTNTRRRRSLDDLTSESVRQAQAEENVHRGRAHALLFEYMRAARTLIEPEAKKLAEALPLGPSATVQGWGRGYLGRVAEVGREAAVREPIDSTIDDSKSGARRPDLIPAYNEATRQATAGGEERTAEICLGVAPDRPVAVTLRRSSGHAALDQLAIAAFDKASLTRPMAGDVRPGLACYQVRVSAFRVPPLPALGFGIKKGKPEVTYPLKRLTKVTVDLVSVDHGDSGNARGLLRPR